MIAVVVLNGEPPQPERLRKLASSFPVYAADGGAEICLQAGVKPQWVAGDLDSAQVSKLPADWEVRHFPEQTRTDFQKVVAELPDVVTDLVVLGGLGRRTDHLLTNLMIAAGFDEHLRISFEREDETLIRVTPQIPFEKTLGEGKTISLLPLSGAKDVQTEGLRWNLQGAEMKVGGQLGQSNEVMGPVSIRISEGCLFVWLPKS